MPEVELHLPPDVQYVGLARLVVTTAARQAGMVDARLEDLKIAVSEATTNAISAHRRASRPEPVVLAFGATGGSFAVTIADSGPGFEVPDDEGARDREWTDEHGLGLILIRDLADDVRFTNEAGMTVALRFAVALAAEDDLDDDDVFA